MRAKPAQRIRIEYVPLSKLAAWPRNPKAHNLDALERSFRSAGFVEPPVHDEATGQLIAGNGRLEKLLDLKSRGEAPPDRIEVEHKTGDWLIPVVRGISFPKDVAKGYLVGSNQIAISGGWNDQLLAEILAEVAKVPQSVAASGFSSDELTKLIDEATRKEEPSGGDPDAPPEEPTKVDVKPGDVWALGEHRVICGDCRDPGVVARLLGDERVNVCVTSPPYASQRKYDEASGFKPIRPDEYVAWFEAVAENVATHLAEDGSFFLNIKEHCEDGQRSLYVKDLVLAHVRQWGWRFVDEFCWERPGPPGRWPDRFKNSWEPVFHFARIGGRLRFRPDHVLVETDAAISVGPISPDRSNGEYWHLPRTREAGLAWPSNVLKIGSAGSEADGHQAAYPVALPSFFVNAFSDPGDIVFDPFMGSGTTLIAAETEGRAARGSEISPRYTQMIINRWEKLTGKRATRMKKSRLITRP